MEAQHKKLGLGIGLLALAVVLLAWLGPWSSGPALPKNKPYVCVATGEVFRFSGRDIPGYLPGKNPKTGENTLLPVEEKDGGKLVVISRYRDAFADPDLVRLNRYVDPKTLEILKEPRPQPTKS